MFGQITLTFRYGREDEEVMGLKFCNEAIMCLAQIYPPHENAQREQNTPLQVHKYRLYYACSFKNKVLFFIIFTYNNQLINTIKLNLNIIFYIRFNNFFLKCLVHKSITLIRRVYQMTI